MTGVQTCALPIYEFIASEELNGVVHETSHDNCQDASRDRGKGWNKGKEPSKDYKPRSPERNGSRNDPGARSRFSPKGQEQRGPREDKAVERPPGDFQQCPHHPAGRHDARDCRLKGQAGDHKVMAAARSRR